MSARLLLLPAVAASNAAEQATVAANAALQALQEQHAHKTTEPRKVPDELAPLGSHSLAAAAGGAHQQPGAATSSHG